MKVKALITLLCIVLPLSCVTIPDKAAREGLTESLYQVRLNRGSKLNVLVSKRTGTNPTTAVLLFPGYPGILKLKEEEGSATYDLVGNFFIRSRRFLNSNRVFTILVDCPVDQWNGCGDAYRSSKEHAADIVDVIDAVKKAYGAQQVYIAGTSYGTVSTSFLARALEDKIDGAIHTSTFTDPAVGRTTHGTPMASFDWSRTKVPQLFIHHKDDPCEQTRYSSIASRKKNIPLITVEGVSNPKGKACDAYTAHGFVGRERPVMTAMHNWITDRKVPAMVGGAE